MKYVFEQVDHFIEKAQNYCDLSVKANFSSCVTRGIAYKESHLIHMASVVKMIILICSFKAIDEKIFSKNELINRKELNETDTCSLSFLSKSVHQCFSIEELLTLMIHENDSIIADYFLKRLSFERINDYLHSCQIFNTNVNSTILDLNAKIAGLSIKPSTWTEYLNLLNYRDFDLLNGLKPNDLLKYNYTTNNDFFTLLLQLFNGILLSEDSTKSVCSILMKQGVTEYAPYFFTPDQRAGCGHSIGIVCLENKFYTINDVGFIISRFFNDPLLYSISANNIRDFKMTKFYISLIMDNVLSLATQYRREVNE